MGQGKDDSKLTIFTYAQNWLDDLAAQGVSANKLKSHQMMLRVLHKAQGSCYKLTLMPLNDAVTTRRAEPRFTPISESHYKLQLDKSNYIL